ncbi:MAG: ROK family protein [Anaerolineae bacterium]|nr:ROK family protein [Anaerolineae bacterium]
MGAKKATHEQLKRHNRQLLLRTIFWDGVNNRAALAQATGLAKPTVSDLIADLIADGLLIEGGHGESTDSGGKRPRLLEFVPGARQVIGLSLNGHQALGVLSNLDGQIIAEHVTDTTGIAGEALAPVMIEAINGLIAQLDAPLLCLGVGVPGLVDQEGGLVRSAPQLGWRNYPVAALLRQHFEVTTYLGNNTELAAAARLAFKVESDEGQLVTVLIGDGVEVGIAGAVYHSGGDLGCLRIGGNERLDHLLGWPAIVRRMRALAHDFAPSSLNPDAASYLRIRHAADNGDSAALVLVDELADYLSYVVGWIIALLRPDHIVFVGPIADLGERLIASIEAKAEHLLQPDLIAAVKLSATGNAERLSAQGAVALALREELGTL